ncbi:maleylpyruvate isomerase N-terminal domain-containing protein [Streptomyces griseocarneus]|uniref:maleylpyruvate isomerase N-terminal domain-containing protein n=1 Tax=Streptomyces griseocarneus TaxID=51201 RepID=UPI00167E305F|nr:maleylpyruvate isomerase N-terminal domain-containing protein [Streptomyces griseocarneus]MBZ6475562.1 maleylpyruvate isomerase N-terminal domain-containing protein [Streptomyces griseocarneus]GHG69568.1 hypothetical protein GCM10018779_43000 [Streptomyces griseocarneus]
MYQPSHARLCDEIAQQAGHLAEALARLDYAGRIDTCPGWTAAHLMGHVHTAFVWATGILTSPGAEFHAPHAFLPEIPEGALDPAMPWSQYVDALARAYLDAPSGQRAVEERLVTPVTSSADAFVAALRGGGPDAPAWTTYGEPRSRFWAAWGALEAAVHRADADIALGAEPRLDPDVALSSLNFWFTSMGQPGVAAFLNPRLADLRRSGELILFRGDGTSPDRSGQWLLRLSPSGPALVAPDSGRPDATVRASADQLLLLTKRRLPVTAPTIRISGDTGLVRHWLDHVLA